MPETHFITALDVLFPRGNRLFGAAGQHGEAQMPPWPSVAAGAIRSRMLADGNVDFPAFAHGARPDGPLGDSLGIPADPGSFRIAWFSLARRVEGGVEPLIALPADLSAAENEDAILYLNPQFMPAGLKCGAATAQSAVLRQEKADKPQGGLWLTGAGLAAYLRGQPVIKPAHTVKTRDLWMTDQRVGIALDTEKRIAAEGRIYTSEAVALRTKDRTCEKKDLEFDVGFVVQIAGADGLVPRNGLVRLGGDGRGARIDACEMLLPEPDWDRIAKERRFRLVLSTPGLFEQGWRLPGIQPDGVTWQGPNGASARLLCAEVSRAQVVSGWDLAQRVPKAALRAAPAGSVYWFESFEGDISALRKLAEDGFGCLSSYPDRARHAEGFNNALVANWAAGGA